MSFPIDSMKYQKTVTSILLFCLPLLVDAHRQPEALTTIVFNPNSQATEIVHQLHAHDLDVILRTSKETVARNVDSLEAQAHIALYIESHFQILDPSTQIPLKLSLIGAELEGDTLYVFQEYEKTLDLPINIANSILHEYFVDQVNIVNLKRDGRRFTAVFIKADEVTIPELDLWSD
ncbi:MAG: DUF6702 family protein [Verrucomicrobiota bacterium]